MTCLHKVLSLIALLAIGAIIDSTYSVQAGWVKKIKEANSTELEHLKSHCLSMLNRKDNSIETNKRWNNRLKRIKKCEQSLKGKEIMNENEIILSPSIDQTKNQNLVGKKSLKEVTSLDEWPETLEFLSSQKVSRLQTDCSKMVEYEDLLVERKFWSNRLHQLDTFQEKLKKRKSELNQKKNLESQKKLNEDPTYKTRFIYVDNKNPKLIDLHGVASAQVAQKRVSEFIRAAKSKRKEYVKVITGKGNHINHRGQQGVLFKFLPDWIVHNASVKGYKVSKEGGGYVIYLHPSLKVRCDAPILSEYLTIYKEMKNRGPNLCRKHIYQKSIRLRHKEKLIKRDKLIGFYDYASQFASFFYNEKPSTDREYLDKEALVSSFAPDEKFLRNFELSANRDPTISRDALVYSTRSSLTTKKLQLEDFLTDLQKKKLGLYLKENMNQH